MDGNHHQHGHHHEHPHAGETDDSAMAELLDLEAEVLHEHMAEVITWIQELAGDPPHRIVDLGSGTGTGVLALLERFRGSEAIALDVSADMLERLEAKARSRGVADRIHAVRADLDAAWPPFDPVDLAWASSSLHHMAAPDRVLTEVLAALRPGGLLAVLEIEAFPRFLPDDIGLGRPGLEERCHAVLAEQRADDLPHLGSDWGLLLSQAGFTVEAERAFGIDLQPPLPSSAGRYAQTSLRRVRSSLDGRISADDLAVLDTLVDSDGPDGVLNRSDLTVRTTRSGWLARRP